MEKPILFNTEMVRAILEGRKTQTRRIIKRTPSNDDPCGYGFWKEFSERDNKWYVKDYTHSCVWWGLEEYTNRFSKYHVGDILYVRETWQDCTPLKSLITNGYIYRADKLHEELARKHRIAWSPSIHMPKKAARIFLKITDVRIERLQEMSFEDMFDEGIEVVPGSIAPYPSERFKSLWDSIIKKSDIGMYGWNENPWVWVIEFERSER